MFTETLRNHDDVIGIVCDGKLTEDDLRRMHALLHERLASVDNPSLVVDLTGFEGYADLAALREDAKIDSAHRNDFSRIAVIGDKKQMEWGRPYLARSLALTCSGSIVKRPRRRRTGRGRCSPVRQS